MEMSRGEILVRYRQALDRQAQLLVLAELCDCDWEEIVPILQSAGWQGLPQPAPQRRDPTQWDSRYSPAHILPLVEKGYSLRQIVDHIGCRTVDIQAAFRRHGESWQDTVAKARRHRAADNSVWRIAG